MCCGTTKKFLAGYKIIPGEKFIKEEGFDPESGGLRYVDFPIIDKLEVYYAHDAKNTEWALETFEYIVSNWSNTKGPTLFNIQEFEETKLPDMSSLTSWAPSKVYNGYEFKLKSITYSNIN
jgi:hypothetical protein